MASQSSSPLFKRLHRTRNVLLRTQLAEAAALFLTAAGAIILFALIVESMAHMSILGRTIFAYVSIGLVVAAGIYFLAPTLLKFVGLSRRPSEEEIALLVGNRYPVLHDALANAMQLKRLHASNSSVGYSDDLVEASYTHVELLARDLDFNAAISQSELRRKAAWMAPSLLLPILLLGLVGDIRDAGFRLAHFSTSFAPPPLFTFEITPGNVSRVRGDSVSVTIRTVGREPQHEIILQTRESDQQDPRPTILHSNTGSFSYTFDAVKRSVEYFAEAKGETSEHFAIKVNERPDVKSLAVRLVYPSYTHTPTIELDENAGDIVGLNGTQAQIGIKSNKELATASILFVPDTTGGDSTRATTHISTSEVHLHVDGMEAHGSLTVNGSGTYTVKLVDPDGVTNHDPIVYHVMALRDEFPSIRVLQPQAVTDITEQSKIGIVSRIHDDFGFSKMLLHYRLSQSKFANPWPDFRVAEIPFTADGKTDLEVPYIWDLSHFALVPEDALEFYVEILDNDIVHGPKSARSEILTLRLPSLEAALHESDQSQNDAQQNLQEAEKAAEDLQQQMEQTTRELRQQSQEKDLSFLEKKKMQDIVKKQEQLQKKVEEAQQQLQESVDKLESKNALSPETLQKYMELQKLFQEMKSPEMMAAMKRLQDAMEKLSPEQMRQAMKNFTLNEEQFKQSIERTMEMLKRIQAEQKVDELMKRADDIQKQQEQLAQDTKNAKTKAEKDAAMAKQKDLAERTAAMKKEFEELQKKMSELGKDMPNKEMKDAADQLKQDDPQSEMQDAEQEMSNDPEAAEKSQSKAQQGMKNFSMNMAAAKRKLEEQQKKEMMTEMRRALEDLLELSKREEALQQQTRQSESNSATMPEQAKQQANMQSDLGSVVNRMMKLAQKSFGVTPEMGKELGRGLREMQNSTGNLEQRQPQQAGQNEGNAVGAMNSAAKMMEQAVQAMAQGQNQPGSGSGMKSFMQQLNDMAGQQESINGMMPQMGNQGSMSMQQQAQMQRLAAQQQAVERSLEDLSKKQSDLTGGKKNIPGDLDHIAEEMQEVVKDMRSNNVRPETIQRQERILSRLLDAQHSTHDRDFDKKREGKAGTNVARESPPQLPTFQKTRSLDELLRLQEAGYSKDYERRIRKYFESLRGAVPQ